MVLPVYHIVRCVKQPVKHLESAGAVFIVCGIEEYRVVDHHRSGVGSEAGLYYRQVGMRVKLPPVKGERLGSLAPEHNIQVMYTGDVCIYQVRKRSSGKSRIVRIYRNSAERLAFHIVYMELNGSLASLPSYNHGNKFLTAILKINRAHAHPVAIVYISHIVVPAGKTVILQPTCLCHRFGLNTFIWVKILDRCYHTLFCERDERN